LLPEADEKALNNIPLITESGRAEKFALGSLAKLKGKTIDEVISESVSNYYERSNFNNTTEINALLKDLGINTSKIKHHFPELNNLMNRRHYIVHRADKAKKTETSSKKIVSLHELRKNPGALVAIKSSEVLKWKEVVTDFCATISGEILEKSHRA
jgi:hypothetical protein